MITSKIIWEGHFTENAYPTVSGYYNKFDDCKRILKYVVLIVAITFMCIYYITVYTPQRLYVDVCLKITQVEVMHDAPYM